MPLSRIPPCRAWQVGGTSVLSSCFQIQEHHEINSTPNLIEQDSKISGIIQAVLCVLSIRIVTCVFVFTYFTLSCLVHYQDKNMETILSHRDACKALRISKPTLYRLTNQGKLQKIRVSDGRVGWLQSSIERYIATCVKDTLKTQQKK